MGQLPMQEGALFSPEAHDPEQFSRHSDCEQEVLSGQMHDPACPRADAIPASSRTIETIASFFIKTTLFILGTPRVHNTSLSP